MSWPLKYAKKDLSLWPFNFFSKMSPKQKFGIILLAFQNVDRIFEMRWKTIFIPQHKMNLKRKISKSSPPSLRNMPIFAQVGKKWLKPEKVDFQLGFDVLNGSKNIKFEIKFLLFQYFSLYKKRGRVAGGRGRWFWVVFFKIRFVLLPHFEN